MKIILMSLLAASLAVACHPKPAEGPAERAGEKIDNAAHDTKEAAHDTKEDVKKDLKK